MGLELQVRMHKEDGWMHLQCLFLNAFSGARQDGVRTRFGNGRDGHASTLDTDLTLIDLLVTFSFILMTLLLRWDYHLELCW